MSVQEVIERDREKNDEHQSAMTLLEVRNAHNEVGLSLSAFRRNQSFPAVSSGTYGSVWNAGS